MPDGVEEDVVAENVPLDGLQEGRAAALQAFEQVRAAESDEPLASPGQVVDLSILFLTRWRLWVIQ